MLQYIIAGGMLRKLSFIIGWAGGIYGVLRGAMLASQPVYAYSSSRAPAPGQPAIPEPPPTLVSADPLPMFVIIAVVLLVFGGMVALLALGQREVFTLCAVILFVFSLLSLPSIGWIFLPATSLLFLSALLAWLSPTVADAARDSTTAP